MVGNEEAFRELYRQRKFAIKIFTAMKKATYTVSMVKQEIAVSAVRFSKVFLLLHLT